MRNGDDTSVVRSRIVISGCQRLLPLMLESPGLAQLGQFLATAATDSLLLKYESIIKASDVFNDVATLRQQLVVLGTPKTVAEWRFYAYENDGFVLML